MVEESVIRPPLSYLIKKGGGAEMSRWPDDDESLEDHAEADEAANDAAAEFDEVGEAEQ